MSSLSARISTLALILALATAANAQKLSADLDNQPRSGNYDVIVEFDGASKGHHSIVQGKGGSLLQEFQSLTNHARYSVPGESLDDLAHNKHVKHISLNHKVRPYLDLTAMAVNAELAWQAGFDGSGVDIAVLDSGISVDGDLTDAYGRSRVDYSESFLPGDSSTADAYGHGTHVAGILSSSGRLSSSGNAYRSFIGMAPASHLVNLRVLDKNGMGTDATVIAAIDRAIALKNIFNIRVINLSLGRPAFESYQLDPLCLEVEKAWKAGIVVVVAAGNNGRLNDQGQNGYGTITAPGNDPYVITVGAMKTNGTFDTSDDTIATYSSKGPTYADHIVKPDIVAPGNLVDSIRVPGSTLDVQYPQNRVMYSTYLRGVGFWGTVSPGAYFTLSGTSMATPVVAGAAALMVEEDPTLTPDIIKARLMKTARKTFPTVTLYTDPTTGITYTSQYDVFTVGAGYLDIAAALANQERPQGLALSPTAVYDSTTGNCYMVGTAGQSVVWGGSIAWGSSVVWGGSVVSGTSIAWGSSVVWGGSIAWGSSVVWGGNSMNANSITWGSSAVSDESAKLTMIGGER